MNKNHPKLALVIGSGGLKCAAAMGVMQVLEAEHIAIDMVVGCSGGSVFGAAIALGFSYEETRELCAQTWSNENISKKDLRSILKIIFPKRYGFDDKMGIFSDHVMSRNLEKAFGTKTTFTNTKIPFYCVATDFRTGTPVVISEGKVAKALRASSGIPVIFQPLDWDGQLLIDGGLSNPLPVDVAIQEGADIIIAVGFETPLLPSVSSAGNFARQLFNILVNQLLYKQYAFYNLAYHSEIIPIILDFEEDIGLNDIHQIPFIVEQGVKETHKHIPFLKKVLDPTQAV
jgi:NTE family protein